METTKVVKGANDRQEDSAPMDDEKTKNPYPEGSATYLAWEYGYLAALDDVSKIWRVDDRKDGEADG